MRTHTLCLACVCERMHTQGCVHACIFTYAVSSLKYIFNKMQNSRVADVHTPMSVFVV